MSRFYVIGVIFIAFAVTACSDKAADKKNDKAGQSSPALGHKSDKQAEKFDYVTVVKRQILPDYPVKTIGAAFDSYSHFVKNEWLVSEGARGKVYIDYTGWIADKNLEKDAAQRGVSAQGIAVKFVVEGSGDFGVVLISKVEKRKDNTISAYPIENMKDILDKIYGDREIRF